MDGRKQLRALLDTSRDLTAVVDDDGVIQYVNAAAKRLLGYAPDELVGTDSAQYIHPADRQRVQTALEAADDSPRVGVEVRLRAADDSWVQFRSQCATEEDPLLGGYVVNARVASERHSTPNERGRNRLYELAETSNEVLWMFTADWDELLFVNSAYESVWGRSVSVLYEDSTAFLEGIHPADRERVEQAMKRLTNGTSVDIEYRVTRPMDDSRWVWVQGEPVFEDDEVVRVVGFARDVSERHERTRQLQVIDRVLRHNLRNSMNIVLGYASELDDELDADGAQSVRRLRSEGERLLELADKQRELVNVLTTERQVTTVDLGRVVTETVDAIDAAYPDCHITTEIDEAATVLAFPKIDLAVHELLVNALEHCDSDDPTVTVAVRVDEETVTLEVRDRNSPIPEQNTMVLTGEREIADLFHGEGVGLWLVYWLFERSNGEVTFTRYEPNGNCVRGLLPRAEPR